MNRPPHWSSALNLARRRKPDVLILTRFAIRPDREVDEFVAKFSTVDPWRDEEWLAAELKILGRSFSNESRTRATKNSFG
jgi:hypothetical protein